MSLHLTDEFKLSIDNDPKNCVLFVGAGLSASSVKSDGTGLPTWAGLIEAMINDLQNSGKGDAASLNLLFRENKYLEIAEIFKSKKRADQYSDFLKSYLDPSDLSPSKIHALILSIGFKGILTTNFDYVFETTGSNLSPLIYPRAGRARRGGRRCSAGVRSRRALAPNPLRVTRASAAADT